MRSLFFAIAFFVFLVIGKRVPVHTEGALSGDPHSSRPSRSRVDSGVDAWRSKSSSRPQIVSEGQGAFILRKRRIERKGLLRRRSASPMTPEERVQAAKLFDKGAHRLGGLVSQKSEPNKDAKFLKHLSEHSSSQGPVDRKSGTTEHKGSQEKSTAGERSSIARKSSAQGLESPYVGNKGNAGVAHWITKFGNDLQNAPPDTARMSMSRLSSHTVDLKHATHMVDPGDSASQVHPLPVPHLYPHAQLPFPHVHSHPQHLNGLAPEHHESPDDEREHPFKKQPRQGKTLSKITEETMEKFLGKTPGVSRPESKKENPSGSRKSSMRLSLTFSGSKKSGSDNKPGPEKQAAHPRPQDHETEQPSKKPSVLPTLSSKKGKQAKRQQSAITPGKSQSKTGGPLGKGFGMFKKGKSTSFPVPPGQDSQGRLVEHRHDTPHSHEGHNRADGHGSHDPAVQTPSKRVSFHPEETYHYVKSPSFTQPLGHEEGKPHDPKHMQTQEAFDHFDHLRSQLRPLKSKTTTDSEETTRQKFPPVASKEHANSDMSAKGRLHPVKSQESADSEASPEQKFHPAKSRGTADLADTARRRANAKRLRQLPHVRKYINKNRNRAPRSHSTPLPPKDPNDRVHRSSAGNGERKASSRYTVDTFKTANSKEQSTQTHEHDGHPSSTSSRQGKMIPFDSSKRTFETPFLEPSQSKLSVASSDHSPSPTHHHDIDHSPFEQQPGLGNHGDKQTHRVDEAHHGISAHRQGRQESAQPRPQTKQEPFQPQRPQLDDAHHSLLAKLDGRHRAQPRPQTKYEAFRPQRPPLEDDDRDLLARMDSKFHPQRVDTPRSNASAGQKGGSVADSKSSKQGYGGPTSRQTVIGYEGTKHSGATEPLGGKNGKKQISQPWSSPDQPKTPDVRGRRYQAELERLNSNPRESPRQWPTDAGKRRTPRGTETASGNLVSQKPFPPHEADTGSIISSWSSKLGAKKQKEPSYQRQRTSKEDGESEKPGYPPKTSNVGFLKPSQKLGYPYDRNRPQQVRNSNSAKTTVGVSNSQKVQPVAHPVQTQNGKAESAVGEKLEGKDDPPPHLRPSLSKPSSAFQSQGAQERSSAERQASERQGAKTQRQSQGPATAQQAKMTSQVLDQWKGVVSKSKHKTHELKEKTDHAAAGVQKVYHV